jgi:hypothetical protein
MMKKNILKSIFIFTVIGVNIFNFTFVKQNLKSGLCPLNQIEALSNGESSTAEEPIVLQGDLGNPKQRSLAQQPVMAFVNAYAVSINFLANLGPIVIHIYNGSGGIVFQQSVNASGGQQTFIDIASFSTGNYTITFTNAQNQYMYGGFMI